VAKGLSPSDLNRLARIGASARLANWSRRFPRCGRAFPGLRPSAPDAMPGPVPPPVGEGRGGGVAPRPAQAHERR